MPRQPKKRPNHPIRRLRSVIQKRQGEFATIIGISPDYLKKIENGERTFRPRIAHLVFLATGADSKALLKGRLRWRDGRVYTEQNFRQWCSLQRGVRGRDRNLAWRKRLADDYLRAPIEFTLRAAIESGRWMSVVFALKDAIEECQRVFNLTERVNGMRRREEIRRR
jgi:transcriptional regulator with XRE-family HTH domain